MEYKGFTIRKLDEYLSGLPAEVTDRRADFPRDDFVFVFDRGNFVGVFPSLEAAMGFVDGLIARQVSAAELRAEYERYLDAAEYRTRIFLIGAFNIVRDIENEIEDLDPSDTPGPR